MQQQHQSQMQQQHQAYLNYENHVSAAANNSKKSMKHLRFDNAAESSYLHAHITNQAANAAAAAHFGMRSGGGGGGMNTPPEMFLTGEKCSIIDL